MRILSMGGGIGECLPILTKEVFNFVDTDSSDVYTLLSPKSNFDKVVIEISVFAGDGRSAVRSFFVENDNEDGIDYKVYVMNDDGEEIIAVGLLEYNGNSYLRHTVFGGYNNGTLQITVIDIDADVTKSKIVQSTASTTSHTIDVVDMDKTFLSLAVVGRYTTPSNLFPVSEGVDLSFMSGTNGCRAVVNSETELSFTTVDTRDYRCYIRQFS